MKGAIGGWWGDPVQTTGKRESCLDIWVIKENITVLRQITPMRLTLGFNSEVFLDCKLTISAHFFIQYGVCKNNGKPLKPKYVKMLKQNVDSD